MITEKISNGGVLSGTIGIGSSNNLVGGNINTFTKETDPTIPDYIKAISKENIAGWDNNAVVNEEQNKTLMGLEELIDIITPKETAKGELVHITDALGLHTFGTKTAGQVRQETTSGKQLYNYEDTTTVSDGVTTDKDGWITMTYDNTNGTTTNYLNLFTNRSELLKENTEYRIIVEIKNITQTTVVPGSYLTLIGVEAPTQFSKNIAFSIYQSTKGTFAYNIKTKESFEETTMMTRNFLAINKGDSVSVTFRLSVLEDTTVTPETFVYEKFTGGQASPNPDYPQEIEVVEGYNLYDPNITNFNNKNVSSFEKKGIENGSVGGDAYKLYSTNTRAVAYINLSKIDTYTISSKYMIVQLCEIDENGTITKILSPYTFTNTKNTIGIVFKKDNSNTAFTDSEYDDLKNSIQIVEGTTPKPYLPYGCVGYKVNGKNLFDENEFYKSNFNNVVKVENGYKFDIVKSENVYIVEKAKPNTQYTFKGKITGLTGVNLSITFKYTDGTTKYAYELLKRDNSENSFKLTTDETKTLSSIIIKFYNQSTYKIYTFQDFMLSEEDNTYEPYQEQIVPLDLKGNWVGKISDSIKDYLVTDKKKLWLIKNVGKVVLDGSENYIIDTWFTSDDNSTHFKYYFIKYGNTANTQIVMSTHFKFVRGKKQNNGYIYTNLPAKFLLLSTNAISTVEEFKQWLKQLYDNGTPVTVYYIKETPEIIELGELPEPIKTFEGVNNIQVLANLDTEIEVKYALDLKKYADDRYFELTNALISTGANL